MPVIPTHNGSRLYENYSPDIEDGWDAIIVGSGMGGMSCAAALSHYGHKVLVLEQHYLPGGFTHMFGRKGFQWDVGVHAIGEMEERDLPGRMLRWLTNDRVKWQSLGDPYDRFRFPDGLEITFPDSKKEFIAVLKKHFPDQSDKIDEYVKLVQQVGKDSKAWFAFKSFPEWLDSLGTKVHNWTHRDWWSVTTEEVLDELGIEGHLRNVLTAQWGYIGSVPSESSFAIQALIHVHFWHGAYYPIGGSKTIAEGLLIPVVEAGGAIRTKASVAEVELENGKAVGVRMQDGRVIRGKKVISAAGAKNTVNHLVPEEHRNIEWAEKIRGIGDSPSYVGLNLGFEGDILAAGASPANLWLFNTWELNQTNWDATDPDSTAHILYVSFPSLKDPEHDPGPNQKHTGECITFIPWDMVARWSESMHGDRDEDYMKVKQNIEDRLLAQLRESIPEVMDLCTFHELSTPLSAQFFARASHGAIYGLEATPERFRCSALRARTPFKNFLMTGVDSASLGVVGAMTSGMLTAAVLEKRVYLKMM